MANIPPGKYRHQVSGPGIDGTAWWPQSAVAGDRDLFDGLITIQGLVPASVKVSLAECEKKTQDLRLGGGMRLG